MKFELPRGMRDLEPEEYDNINLIKNAFIETAKIFNFKLMEPSPLELLSTLESKSGPGIINEIYSFTDKGNRKIALRFDLTIGLTRYFTIRRDLKIPAKIASFGGVWRYDEPQSGRYRFFHQWDIEIYGPKNIELDAEVIEFTSFFLKKVGLKNIIIDISSRKLIEEFIKEILKIDDEEILFEIFRAIDKIPKKGKETIFKEYHNKIEKKILEEVIKFAEKKGNLIEIEEFIKPLNLNSWTEIKEIVNSLFNRRVDNIRINLGIVRGLDYYSGIVFEAIDQNSNFGSLVGGGRYDKLTEIFGREEVGATGAAGGIERTILALRNQHTLTKSRFNELLYIVYNSPCTKEKAKSIASSLRGKNIPVEYDLLSRSVSKQIVDAENKKARAIIFIKEENFKKNNTIIFQDCISREEKTIRIDNSLTNLINEILLTKV